MDIGFMKIDKSDLIIREFMEADIEEVHKIEQDLFPNPWTVDMFKDDVLCQDKFTKVVKGQTLNCKTNYLLEYRGEVIGFFMGWAIFDEYSVMNIGIKSSYHKLGLGSFLLEAMLLKAIQLECEVVYLEVRASNIPACNLYKKFNFVEIAKRKDYYSCPNEDAIVMKHEIKIP